MYLSVAPAAAPAPCRGRRFVRPLTVSAPIDRRGGPSRRESSGTDRALPSPGWPTPRTTSTWGFSVSKARIGSAVALDGAALAAIDTGYLVAYAIGQFGSGALGDYQLPRLVAAGMLAYAACLLFGSRPASCSRRCFVANGLAQSTGWPGTWYGGLDHRGSRRRDGFWSTTCYQVGGIAATAFTARLLRAHTAGARRWCRAWIAAVGLLLFALRESDHLSGDAAAP